MPYGNIVINGSRVETSEQGQVVRETRTPINQMQRWQSTEETCWGYIKIQESEREGGKKAKMKANRRHNFKKMNLN